MKSDTSRLHKVHAITFVLTLCVLGITTLVLPGKNQLAEEGRSASKFPQWSISSLKSGKYTQGIDEYYADHFAFRDFWMKISFRAKQAQSNLVASQEIQIVPKKNVSKAENQPEQKDQGENLNVEVSKGLAIADGRALQLFGGSTRTAKRYAKLINRFADQFGPNVSTYCEVVPSATPFYLLGKHAKLTNSEKRNIDSIYANLSPEVKSIDAFTEISKHRKEYIYFNTDHHWTGLGAFYGYTAFCKSADLKPINYLEKPSKVISNFLGSLYRDTQHESLGNNPDSVIWYPIPVKNEADIYHENAFKPQKGMILYDYAKGVNSYGVYLGEDFPLMHVKTGNKNGKKLVIVKNSFGNPMATYLLPHYEEIFIVDYRYFKGGLSQLVKSQEVTDVLFIHVSFSANTDWHISKMNNLLNSTAFNYQIR